MYPDAMRDPMLETPLLPLFPTAFAFAFFACATLAFGRQHLHLLELLLFFLGFPFDCFFPRPRFRAAF